MLDAGPLLTYLGLRYLDSINASKAKRDAIFHDLRPTTMRFAEPEQDRLRNLMRTRRLLATPHVNVEVLKLRKTSHLADERFAFREFSLTLLDKEIGEETCSIAELSGEPDFRNLVCRFGLTDAALVFIAAKYRCLLLTDDARLFAVYSTGAKYQIRLLDEYLTQS